MSRGGRPPSGVDNMYSLKVDNLTYRTSPETLKRAFQKFGDVGDVYIPRDRYSRESRGFAFVRFYDKHDAEDAMDSMDGKDVTVEVDVTTVADMIEEIVTEIEGEDPDRSIEAVVTPVVAHHVESNHDRLHVHIVDHLEDRLNNQETMIVELAEAHPVHAPVQIHVPAPEMIENKNCV